MDVAERRACTNASVVTVMAVSSIYGHKPMELDLCCPEMQLLGWLTTGAKTDSCIITLVTAHEATVGSIQDSLAQ